MSNAPPSPDKHKHGDEKDDYRPESIAVEQPLHRPSTKRGLNARHALFIAWGGAVGTGLFITTGKTLATGGPAFLVGSYVFLSVLVYFILTGVIEMATFLPVRGGSMSRYARRFASSSLGFALGWVHVYSYAILVPFELTACAILIDYWSPGVSSGVWITVLLVPLVLLNALPVRFYGEAEFFFTGIKLATIVGLILLAFILFWGGGPDRHRLGFHYWIEPGAAREYILTGDVGRLIAVVATVLSSVLPFTFTPEMVVGTAAEIRDPRKNVPRVATHFIWRLVVLFVVSVIGISVICPSDDPTISSGSDAAASPWVAGIRKAGIGGGLDSIVNAVALIAAWSTGNVFLYLSSRSLHSMAMEGSAPRIFQRCTAKGVPIYAVLATSCVSLLAYLSLNSSSAGVLTWLVNLVNTGGFISWVVCSITYLRFRRACDFQGVPASALQRSRLQPYTSWITLVLFSILCLFNGFTVFFPSEWDVASFLSSYVGLPAFFILYFGHRFTHRAEPWAIPSHLVDLKLDPAEVEDN